MPKSGVVDQITAHRGLASLPDVWVDLAHGRISPEEALGRAEGVEDAELAQRTARMLTPPTAAQTQERLRAALGHHDADAHVPTSTSPRRSGRWIVGVVALVAAMVLLVIMPRVQPGVGAFEAGYRLELGGAVAAERDDVPRFSIDRPVVLTLRPAHRVIEAVDVRAFATQPDGSERELPIEPHASPEGEVEIVGEPGAWGLDPGRWKLVVVVGPPAGLPETEADVRTSPAEPYDVQEAWIEVLETAER